MLRSIPIVGPATSASLPADTPELDTPATERPRPYSSTPALAKAALMRADAISATDAPNRAANCNKAALTAIRRNPALATLRQHLRERGKQPKLALVAVMCKLVTHADAPSRASRL